MKDMPSLKNMLSDILSDEDNYKDAVFYTSRETGIDKSKFPIKLPYSLEEIMDDTFYPFKLGI